MKKLLNLAFVVLILFGAMNVSAQDAPKLGHINTNELLRQMPGRDSAQAELERYARELETTFMEMQDEFQRKYQEYLEKQETFSPLVRQSRERELESLQQRIMEFQESAQEDLMQQEERLLNPIIQKARTAIREVADENGFTYIFDTSGGSVLYWDRGENIMPMVREKLDL